MFLLYKLGTWLTCIGLKSQTSSAFVTNYQRSPQNNSPVCVCIGHFNREWWAKRISCLWCKTFMELQLAAFWSCLTTLHLRWFIQLHHWSCFPVTLLQLASPPDPASAAGQMATSWRARSLSSTWGRSRPRKANRCKAVWYFNKIQMPRPLCCATVLLSLFMSDVKIHYAVILL